MGPEWARRHGHGADEHTLAAEYLRNSRKQRAIRRGVSWVVGILLALTLLISWRQQQVNEQQRSINDARMLEANAELMMNESGHLLQRSVLLAADSLNRFEKLGMGPGNTTHLLEAQSGEEIHRIDHEELVRAVLFSPAGKYVATASADRTACLLDLESLRQRCLEGHGDAVTSLAFSRDESYLATASDDNTVRLWKTVSGEGREIGLPYPGSELTFSRDGSLLATVSYDTVHVWSVTDLSEVVQLHHEGEVWAVAFNPGPEPASRGQLAMANRNAVRIWDVPNGREVQHFRHVTASYDGTVRLWFAPASARTGPFFHRSEVLDVAFHPEGRLLATAGRDNVHLWSVPEAPSQPPGARALVKTLNPPAQVFTVAFSPDGQLLATGDVGGTVSLWDLSPSGQQVVARLRHDKDKSVHDVTFSADGSLLASAGHDGTARVWEVATREERHRLRLENREGTRRRPFYSVAFHPEGTLLAAATRGEVRISDLVEDERSSIPLAPGDDVVLHAVAFSPDGRYLAAAGEYPMVFLWQADAPWPPIEGISRLAHEGDIFSLAFSPDGEYLASGDEFGAKVWKLATGEQVAQVSHLDPVRAVEFRPDGRYLATGSDDLTARLWPLRSEDLIFEACARLTIELSKVGRQRFFGDESYREICARQD